MARKRADQRGGALGNLAEGIGTLLGKTEKKASEWLDQGAGAVKAGMKRARKTVKKAKKASKAKKAKRKAKASR